MQAKGKVSVNDTAWLMRTRFTGTWFDERGDVGAGPLRAEYRQRPLLWSSGGKKYLNERTVGVQQNAFHFVAMPRANVPAPIGGVLWYVRTCADLGGLLAAGLPFLCARLVFGAHTYV